MNNKGVGCFFCLISAILICTRYLSAAVFMNGVLSWDASLYDAGLEYVGSLLPTASVITLIIGVLFLVYGIYQDIKGVDKK